MQRTREILTYPLSEAQLRAEFAFSVQVLRDHGFWDCTVLFGYGWGNEYYPGNQWAPEAIDVSHLERKVAEVEGRGIGSLASDDLFLEFSPFELQFCHDSDIHLRFTDDSALVESFFARWGHLGYRSAEWRTGADGTRTLVRGADPDA